MINLNIKPTQKEFYEENGFLYLPGAIPKDSVIKWQRLLENLNRQSFCTFGALSAGKVSFVDDKANSPVSRINDLLGFYPEEVLELMSHESILSIAEAFCGSDVIPLQCDVLFKYNHAASEVLWHQDAIFPREYPYINIGIYLDDSNIDDGCLRLIPGTQNQVQDIFEITQSQATETSNKTDIPANAGDIVIHDLMAVHSSPAKSKTGVRRTIYIEMRPASAVVDQGVQSEVWVELRRRWMGLILRRSSSRRFENQLNLSSPLQSDIEEIREILAHREPPLPANYGNPSNLYEST